MNKQRPLYFYTQDSMRFPNMQECVDHYGSGMLVADHSVLDTLSDLQFNLDKALKDRARLVEVASDVIKQIKDQRGLWPAEVDTLEDLLKEIGEG